MIDIVKNYIINNELINNGDKVLVALSGGPDSVCLLHILCKLRDELNISIGAIHINHLLRGSESYDDENYVINLCKILDVEYYIERINISDISKEKNISLEMAGREERYKAFESIKKKYRYDKIAVGHNANDQAETILMRMMRGTGLEGLTGIRCKREGGIIRPILCLDRASIESYCSENKLIARIDKSNFEKVYNRNKVRLDILPYMKENFNGDIIDTFNRMALLLQSDNEYLEAQADKAYKEYCLSSGSVVKMSNRIFQIEKEAIITRVIKRAFKEASKSHQNFEMKHIYDVMNLNNKSTGKKINLTNDIIVENSYEHIIFKSNNSIDTIRESCELDILKCDIPIKVDYEKYIVCFDVINIKNKIEFSNNGLIKYFDYDNIEEKVTIRHRNDGDRIKPLGMSGSKKLKDIFINLKIPRSERDIVPIVAFDSSVAWVVGYKTSEDFKITKDTKKILKVTFHRKD